MDGARSELSSFDPAAAAATVAHKLLSCASQENNLLEVSGVGLAGASRMVQHIP